MTELSRRRRRGRRRRHRARRGDRGAKPWQQRAAAREEPRARRLDRLVDRLDQRDRHAASAPPGHRGFAGRAFRGHAAVRARSGGARQRAAAPHPVRARARDLRLAALARRALLRSDAGAAASRAAHAQRAAELALLHLAPGTTRATDRGRDPLRHRRETADPGRRPGDRGRDRRRCRPASSGARGVVLAAGDFTSGADLKRRFISEQAAKVEGVNPTATGDGQAMALEVGARIVNGDLALGPEIRFVPPQRDSLVRRLPPWPLLGSFMAWSLDHMPQALLRPFVMSFVTTALAPSPALFEAGAVLINRNGERFCDELDQPALALPDQPEKQAYILLDEQIAQQFSAWPNFISTAPGVAYAYLADYRRNRKDVFSVAPNLAALAEKIGVPAAALEQAIQPARRARPGAVLCAGPGAQRVRAQRGRACGRPRAPRPRAGRPADPRALCCRRHRPGRPSAQRARPPPGLGVHLGPARRADCRDRGRRRTRVMTALADSPASG